MKKLLAILGSLAIGVSASAGVVACGTQAKTDNVEETEQDKKLRYSSLDSVKSLILRNELGLDKKATDEAIKSLTNYPNKKDGNFNGAPSNLVNLNNLDGTLGQKSAPIHKIWNDLSTELKLKDDVKNTGNQYISMFSDSIPSVLKLIIDNAGDANSLIGLVQYGLQSLNKLIPDVDLGEQTIDTVSLILKYLQNLDFNAVIAKMIIGNNPESPRSSLTVGEIVNEGVDALDNLLNNILFRNASADNADDGDANVSIFLGQSILTPLLNKKDIDKDGIIKGLEKNAGTYAIETIESAAQFVASLGLLMSIYVPKLVDEPTDVDHLFGSEANEKVFGNNDQIEIDVVDKNNIKIKDGNLNPLSLNAFIWGTIKLISNQDSKSLGILKLTNILFHDSYDESGNKVSDNSLLSKIVFWAVDSLKFTDNRITFDKHFDGIPVLKSFDLHLDFTLKDLFKEGTPISIKTSVTTINIKVLENGLRMISNPIILPLAKMLILGQNQSDFSNVQGIVTPLYGERTDFKPKNIGILIDGGFLVRTVLNTATAWKPIWEKIGPLFNNLIFNAWYSNIDENLKGLGIDTSEIKGLPLSKTIKDVLSNIVVDSDKNLSINLIDLSKYLNLDFIMGTVRTLVVENSPEAQEKGHTDDPLLKQIILAINKKTPKSKYKEYTKDHINKYLGYVDVTDLSNTKDTAKDDESIYVYEDSFVGSIVKTLYGDSSHYGQNSITISGNNGKAIALKAQDGSDSKSLSVTLDLLNKFKDSLNGEDLKPILKPLIDIYDTNVWNMDNIKVTNKDGQLTGEVYEVSFTDSGKTAKYKITFSRHNILDPYSVTYVEKIK